MKAIDSHQHFWQYNPVRDAWITDDMADLQCDFMPGDLEPLLGVCGVEGTIAVQADQSLDETRFLLELADENPWIRGVVGWVDLRSDGLEADLEFLAAHPKLRGIRHVVQAEKPGFMEQPAFRDGVATLARHNLVYDLLVYEQQLPEAVEFASALSGQPIVLDHMGKPAINGRPSPGWLKGIRELASCDRVYCKLSGMVTETGGKPPAAVNFEPHLDAALEAFGPDRVLFGSDWPVCTLLAGYDEVKQLVLNWASKLSQSEQEAVFYENVLRIYNLEPV